MSEETKIKVGLNMEEEMIFKCDLGAINMADLYVDEKHKRSAEKIGPNPSRLLGLAVLSCLSASFEFCLQKRNLSIEDLNATAEITIIRNEKGFWRIKKIDCNIKPSIQDPKARKRAEQCLKTIKDNVFYEQYCIVTESVRKGIEVNVNVDL